MGRISSFSGMAERVGGDDVRGLHLGVFIAPAREHVLQDGFLLLAQAARVDQVLRVEKTWALARVSSTCASVPSSTCAWVSASSFSAMVDGFLLHFFVFVERHEIGVEADHAIDRGDELLLEQAGW